jgi:hypothetical protein
MAPTPLDPNDLKPGDRGPGSVPIYISSHVYKQRSQFTASMIIVTMGLIILILLVLVLLFINQNRGFKKLDDMVARIKRGEIQPLWVKP